MKLYPFFDSNLKGQIAIQSIFVLVFVDFKEVKFPEKISLEFSAFYAVCIRKKCFFCHILFLVYELFFIFSKKLLTERLYFKPSI